MDLEYRISLMETLGKYMISENPDWIEAKDRAHQHNPWFTPGFIDLALENLVSRYLQKDQLKQWAESHQLPQQQEHPKKIGLVMAGNIPLVGFHDFLSVFISGNKQLIKLSAKDEQLFSEILVFLKGVSPESSDYF